MVSIVDLTDVESVKTGGVTFTADKSTGTITATGTPVRNLVIRVKENITGYDKLLLKGGATGGAGNTYFYALYDNTEPPSVRVAYVTDADSEVVYSADASHSYYVAVVVMKDVAVDGIVGYSVVPLRISFFIGAASATFGVLVTFWLIYKKVTDPIIPMGWASTLCLMTLLFGAVLMVLGVVGEYLGKAILILNKTPQFIIREALNLDKQAAARPDPDYSAQPAGGAADPHQINRE